MVTDGLVKEYNGKKVVSNLSIQVEQGEIYGFLGPNGAGKSTTIGMILGLIPPTLGEIRIFRKTLREDYFKIKQRLGVVGEFQHFYGEMTGTEYLSFIADFYEVKDKIKKIGQFLELVGLSQYRNLQLKAYSKGMQQRLALAKALIHDPDLVILDEPISSLDPIGVKQVRDIILEENKKGKTFLISSHLLSEIEKTCHRIGIIHHGKLLAEDTMNGLKEKLNSGLELEIELENMPAGIVKSLSTFTYIKSVVIQGQILTIKICDSIDRRGEISKSLNELGCMVLSMKKKQISLEEAFVTITENNISLLTQNEVI